VLARCRALDNVDVDVDCQKRLPARRSGPQTITPFEGFTFRPSARILDLIFVFFALGLRQSVLRLCPTGRQPLVITFSPA
jgi:hypothetical protein